MSEPPWTPHHVPTADDLRATLRDQFPEVAWAEVEYLASGWEFDAWATPDGWIFRFPRRAESPAQLERERPLLALARSALSPDVIVPEPELRGRPGPRFPYPFAGHRRVPGVGADDPNLPRHPDLAQQLAGALARIHAVDGDAARAAGAVEEPGGVESWVEETRPLLDALAGVDPAVDRAVVWLRGDPALPPPHAGSLRFIHDDLCPDHVLLDPSTGGLSGILDWTDAALGDPALDFIFLVVWRGWAFTRSVLAHYPGPLDPGLPLRLSYMARVRSLAWLHEALERGGGLEKHIAGVAHAFGGPTG